MRLGRGDGGGVGLSARCRMIIRGMGSIVERGVRRRAKMRLRMSCLVAGSSVEVGILL